MSVHHDVHVPSREELIQATSRPVSRLIVLACALLSILGALVFVFGAVTGVERVWQSLHVNWLFWVTLSQAGVVFVAVQRLARAVESGMGAQGAFVAINNRVSQSVPHLHVHVVPRRQKVGLRGFFWPRQRYESPAAMEEARAAIARALVTG